MLRTEISKPVQYTRDVFAKEDAALANVGKDLPPEEKKMQIGPDEGKILHCLARMVGAKKIVEIGTLAGYSTIWMARALPDGGKLYALEKNEKRIEPIRQNLKSCGVDDKVEVIVGDALSNLPSLNDKGPFDMVFIDADKGNYCNYLGWAEENTRPGGIIVGDNAFLFGAVYGDNTRDIGEKTTKIMQEFNRRLADPAKYCGIMLPTIEGMAVGVKL